ncbi:LysR family transcriptional regulator [Sporosarcina sp. Te-1]|uniref:LysR family transcriptional regulator n=1 Tax=Sporosarcina sp. Te-1 TaxID=2818390 RepID=UPI001A9EE429|nr:LysR family transcriptional regulator [Sporosarcina sp. Te-1]QTD41841.1 LysR family transcriptional regulator [Sporosarcina sp. Te-1]
MDFEKIETFLMIAEKRNFTKAAEALHIAQSTITARINGLEQQVGQQLFIRTNKEVSLTRAGELFYPFAERMITLLKTSMERIQMDGRFQNRLAIAGPSSIWNYRLTENIMDFQKVNPEIALDLLAHTNENTIQKVIDGTIDIGIVYSKPNHPAVAYELLEQDVFVLAGKKPGSVITVDSLNSSHFLFIDWGAPFMNWFHEVTGPHFIPAFKINQTALVIQYLMKGDFFGFVPKSFVFPYFQRGELQELIHNLDDALPSFTMFCIYQKAKKEEEAIRLGLDMLQMA